MGISRRGCPMPIRMSLIELTFKPIDIGGTIFDEHFKQPVRTKKFLPEVKIMGQPNFSAGGKKFFDRMMQSISINWNTPGDLSASLGHIVLSCREIDRAKYMPKKGDVLVKYNNFDPPEGFELLVEEVRPESPLRGKPILYYVELRQDRNKR